MIGGVLNIIYGIAAIGNSSFFTHNTHYTFGSLNTWGWVTLILGILEILAVPVLVAAAARSGGTSRIAVGSLTAIGALLEIPGLPTVVASRVGFEPVDHPWLGRLRCAG